MSIEHKILGCGKIRNIALHGWLGSHEAYDPMLGALDLDKFTYAIPAYRGYGLSRHINGCYTIAEIASDVLSLADRLEWAEFNLIGHSMGAMAAQRVLMNAPQRIQKVVAIAPVPIPALPLDRDISVLFAHAATRVADCEAVINFATGHRLSSTWVKTKANNLAKLAKPEAFVAYWNALNKADFGEHKAASAPLKIIFGEFDPALSSEFIRSTYFHQYPNSQMEVIANAGRFPMDETPIALATSMEAFLSE